MTDSRPYMLPQGGAQETKRLNFQHDFMRHFTRGSLLHPIIPIDEVRTIADVGTGTGIWMDQLSESLQGSPCDAEKIYEMTGFDVSSEQFPLIEERRSGQDYFVHDMTKQFPRRFHGEFDVVHIRFMTCALRRQDIAAAVENVTELLRPGGYLFWEEVEASDVWPVPSTPSSRQAQLRVGMEKRARGLTSSMVTDILKSIFSLQFALELSIDTLPPMNSVAKFSPLSWTRDLFRVLVVVPIYTNTHESAFVRTHKTRIALGVNASLLSMAAKRKRASASEGGVDPLKEDLIREAEEIERLVESLQYEAKEGINDWEFGMVQIVARKAILVGEDDDWQRVGRPKA